MKATREELLAAALALPPDERERMAHDLLDSLDESGALTSEEWEAAWTAEIKQRLDAVREGRAELTDADEVFREAYADLEKPRR